MDRAKILTAAAVFALLMTCGAAIANVSDVSSADETPTYNITLTDTLYFTDQTAIDSSVSKINTLAGTPVCEYANDGLVFTKNVQIVMNSSANNNGMMVFNNGTSSQYVSVNEGVTATIKYNGSVAASSDSVGAVMKKGTGNLSFSGKGELNVYTYVPNSYAVVSSNHFYFEGKSYIYSLSNACKGGIYCSNLYCQSGSKGYVNSYSNGIVMTGTDFIFNNCSIQVYGVKYGIICDNIVNANVESCYADIIGANDRAFSKSARNTSNMLTNVYGSNDVGESANYTSIELSEIAYYKHVNMTSQGSFNNVAGILSIVIPAVIGLVVFIIIIVIIKKKKGPSQKSKSVSRAEPIYEATYEAETAPKSANRGVPEEFSNRGRIELMTQSMVEGASFVLVIDGVTAGYIGPQPAFIDVLSGMREITVLTNDSERKKIYQKNLIVRKGMKVIVSKKIGGYKVDVQ